MKKLNILYSLKNIPLNSRIAIYGSGKIAIGFRKMVDESRKDINVSFFINSFKDGLQDDLSILKYSGINNSEELFDLIIVCSSHWNEIINELINDKQKFYVISNEIMYNSIEISALGNFRFDKEFRNEIKLRLEKCLPFFDRENQKYFKLLMDLRLKDDESNIFEFLAKANELFRTPYLDYIDNTGGVILEGGVFDGADSVNFYNFFKNRSTKIIGFEPFMDAYENGPHYNFLSQKGMEVFPFALWNNNGELTFKKNLISPSSSSISGGMDLIESPNTEIVIIKTITLDTFIENNNINNISLIKMDIEGAEMEALAGAEKTIKSFKPNLAISIYHKKEHLYEIPELLKIYNPDYKFALGFYSPTFIDTVLYAF